MPGGLSVGSLVAHLLLDDRDFVRGISRANSSLTNLGKTMAGVGRTMATFVTLPLLVAGGASVKMAMDFEKAFSEIEGLVGVSRDQVILFRKEVLAMSGETSRPPQELAEALRFITSSGFEGAAALDVLRQSAMTAAAGLGETQQVSDLLTSVINAYGKENITAAQAADTLVAAVREGKAEGPEMATALGYVLPIASQLGVDFNELAAGIAAMTRQGADASTAATNLRQMYSDLLDPSERAKKAMDAMGTSASELRKALAEGGTLQVLKFFRTQLVHNEEALSAIFPNVRALTGALSLTGKSVDEVSQVFANLTDNTGDMSNAFMIASQNSTFKFNQAMSELKIAAIDLGVALLPIFLDIVNAVKGMAQWFSSLSDSGKRMTVAIAAIAAAAGPLLIVLGSIVTIIAALTWEIVAIVAGVAALASGFIYLSENWDAVKERFSDISWWKNMLIDMVQFLVQYNPMALFLAELVKAWNWLAQNGQKAGIMIPTIPDPFQLVVDGLEELKSDTVEYKTEFKSFSDSIVGFAKKAGDALTNLFQKGGGGVNSGPEAAPQVPGTPDNTPFVPTDKSTTWFGDGPIKKVTQAVIDLDRAFQNMITNTFVQFGEALGELFSGESTIGGFLDNILKSVLDFGKMFGKQLIAAGVAALAFENLLLSPGAAIAAGVALIAASGAVASLLKKGPGGGGVSGGGGAPGHLPSEMRVYGEIRGYTIALNQKKEGYRRGRMG